MLDNTGQKTN